MSGPSLTLTCTAQIPKKFPGYSRYCAQCLANMYNSITVSITIVVSPQILYANEGESKRDQEAASEPAAQGERPSYISHKGHEFILTLYHFPSSCEACTRPLWHVFKPPPALECRRCHTKCHKDHLDRKEEVIVPCKGE